MTDLRQAAQQALECIERLNAHGWILADFEDEVYAAIAALKAALEQPEQEPVAWMFQHDETGRMNYVSNDGMNTPKLFLKGNPRYALVCPLYTAPPAAQPEPEPVACRFCHSEKGCWTWQCYHCGEIDDVQKPAPPAAQRPWVGLTEFQFAEIYNKWNDTNGSTPWGLNQALEAKLRKLNK